MKAIFDAYYFIYQHIWEQFNLVRGSGKILDIILKTVKPGQANYPIHIPDGRIFEGNLNNSRYRTLFLYRSHEPNETEIFRSCILPGDTVLDVGANIGWYTTLAASLVQNGSVHSFEPVSVIADELTKNVKKNGFKNVHIHRFALSDQLNTASIFFNTKQWGLSSLRQSEPDNSVAMEVKLDTLDNWVKTHNINHISFIKCDVEGAECLFIKGARNTLLNLQPMIMIEVCARHLANFGNSTQDLLGMLTEVGYKLYKIDRDKNKRSTLQKISKDLPINELNLLAVPLNSHSANNNKIRPFLQK